MENIVRLNPNAPCLGPYDKKSKKTGARRLRYRLGLKTESQSKTMAKSFDDRATSEDHEEVCGYRIRGGG